MPHPTSAHWPKQVEILRDKLFEDITATFDALQALRQMELDTLAELINMLPETGASNKIAQSDTPNTMLALLSALKATQI